MGWLIPLEAAAMGDEPLGAHVRINLAWSRLDGIKPDIRLAATAPAAADGYPRHQPPARNWHPLPPLPARNRHPLILTRNPCRAIKTRNPPRAGRLVFSSPNRKSRHRSTGKRNRTTRRRSASSVAAAGGNLRDVGKSRAAVAPGRDRPRLPGRRARPGEARSAQRRARGSQGHRPAAGAVRPGGRAGLVTASEWDRLRFVAAAEHARIIGTKNPCGLFVRLVRGGLLHFATYDDEAAASVRLRRHLYGACPSAAGRSTDRWIRRGPELSDDARLVQAVRAAAARAGYRGDRLPAAEA